MNTQPSTIVLDRERSALSCQLSFPEHWCQDPDLVHFATLHPQDGRALRYHFDEFMVGWLARVAEDLSRHEYAAVVGEYIDRPLLRMCLEQMLYVDVLVAARALYRRALVRSQTGRESTKPFFCSAEIIPLLQVYWPGPETRCLRPLYWLGLRKYAGRRWRRFKRHFYGLLRGGPIQRLSGPGIAVELVEGINPARKCDAFWLSANAIPVSQVLFLVETANRFFLNVDRLVADAAAIGVRSVTIDPELAWKHNIDYWYLRSIPAWVVECRRRLRGNPNDAVESWLTASLSDAVQRVGTWENFFSEFGVAVYQQSTELTTESIVRRIAVDRVGGIEIGKQRSQFFDDASPAFHFQHEVAFCWHRNAARQLLASRTNTRVLVETGYVYDNLIHSSEEQARQLRHSLASAGASTVITAFDNSPTLYAHFSYQHVSEFYACLAEVLSERPDVGLILKSKKPEIAGNDLLTQSLRRMLDTGRCHLLTARTMSVIPAALACDVAVGIPAATAVCEAALCGKRVLMYDPAQASTNPFASAGNRVVFNRIAEFRAVLNEILADASSQAGRVDGMLDGVDRHRDGQAAMRAAAFIRSFMSGRDDGLSKQAALDKAVADSACAMFVDSLQH